jgi:hypothetical protein
MEFGVIVFARVVEGPYRKKTPREPTSGGVRSPLVKVHPSSPGGAGTSKKLFGKE